MIITLQIAGLFALISFIYLSFTAAKSLQDITKIFDDVNRNINDLNKNVALVKDKVIDTLDEVKILNFKLLNSLEHFDGMSDRIGSSIENIERKTDKFVRIFEPFELLIQETYNRVSPAVSIVSGLFSAGAKALTEFTHRLSK